MPLPLPCSNLYIWAMLRLCIAFCLLEWSIYNILWKQETCQSETYVFGERACGLIYPRPPFPLCPIPSHRALLLISHNPPPLTTAPWLFVCRREVSYNQYTRWYSENQKQEKCFCFVVDCLLKHSPVANQVRVCWAASSLLQVGEVAQWRGGSPCPGPAKVQCSCPARKKFKCQDCKISKYGLLTLVPTSDPSPVSELCTCAKLNITVISIEEIWNLKMFLACRYHNCRWGCGGRHQGWQLLSEVSLGWADYFQAFAEFIVCQKLWQ